MWVGVVLVDFDYFLMVVMIVMWEVLNCDDVFVFLGVWVDLIVFVSLV